jgi:hypothetical protein
MWAMSIKNYQYYVLGAITFLAWVVFVFLALEVAVHFSA